MEQTPKVDVDLGGVRSFADMLRADVEVGLKPGVSRAEREIQHGVRFGLAVAGGQLGASREVFVAALERTRDNTTRQVRGAQILAAAIGQVLVNYAEGDRVAASRMAAVEQALSEAIDAAAAVAQPSPPPQVGGYQP